MVLRKLITTSHDEKTAVWKSGVAGHRSQLMRWGMGWELRPPPEVADWRHPGPSETQIHSAHSVWKLLSKCQYIFLINLFNWRIITMLWWFLPSIDTNQPRVAVRPLILKPPSHLPPYPIPPACPRAPALRALPHASNLHWSSTLHMVIYNIYFFKSMLGLPLVVQWLRLYTSNTGGIGLVLG